MYQRYGDILAISVNDWIKTGLTYNQYNNDLKRGYLNIAFRSTYGNTLIDVKSIKRPDRRAVIEAMYGKIDEVVVVEYNDESKEANRKPYLEIDEKAVEFYRNYTYIDASGNERNLSVSVQEQYVNEASILNMFRKAYQEQTMARAANSKRVVKKEFFMDCAKHAQKLAEYYPNCLPSHYRILEQKYENFFAESNGYEYLISRTHGLSNSEKLTEEAKSWLIARFATPINKVTIHQLFEEYNIEVDRRNQTIDDDKKKWKFVTSEQAIYAFLNKPEIKPLWYGMRYGELISKDKYTRQNKTILPSCRDALWYGDGSKLNYYYRTEDGKMATCNVYEVMDAYSEVLLGYYISDSEDFEAQYMSFRMAMQFSGNRPYEIRYDNQGGHKKLAAGEFFSKLTKLNIPTAPYSGRSKTIESVFGRIQMHFMHKDWFFTGQNITAKKKESRENYEFVMANKANLPTLDEIKRFYEKKREEWNNAKHHETGIPRIEMYRQSVNEESIKVSPLDMITMFGVIDPTPNTYTSAGISKKIKKLDYRWEVLTDDNMPDYDFLRKNVDRKFHIGYDLNDMSMVALYVKEAKGYRFVAMAQKYIEIHRAKQDQTEFDHRFIKSVELANKKMRLDMVDEIESIMERHGMHPAQHGLNMPKPKGISIKKEDVGTRTKRLSNMVTADVADKY